VPYTGNLRRNPRFKQRATSATGTQIFKSLQANVLDGEENGTRFAFVRNGGSEAAKTASLALLWRGVDENTSVTVLTDGDAGLRAIHRQVAPQGEHVLDWFHVSMCRAAPTGSDPPPKTATDRHQCQEGSDDKPGPRCGSGIEHQYFDGLSLPSPFLMLTEKVSSRLFLTPETRPSGTALRCGRSLSS
jgi:hypothetical protein